MLFMNFSLFSQEGSSCNTLVNGKFVLLDSLKGNTYIKRKRNIQIEKGEISKLKLKLKVEWQDSCAYQLTLIKIKRNPNHIIVQPKFKIITKIVQIENRYYVALSNDQNGNQLTRKILIEK